MPVFSASQGMTGNSGARKVPESAILFLTSRRIVGISFPFREYKNLQARNSVGECYLDMVEVGGSIPPAPTTFFCETSQYENVAKFIC